MEIIAKDGQELKTLTIEKAGLACKRDKTQIAIAFTNDKIDYCVGKISTRYGKLVVVNKKWEAYINNCKRLEEQRALLKDMTPTEKAKYWKDKQAEKKAIS